MADLFPRHASSPDEILGIAAGLLTQAGQFESGTAHIEDQMGRAADAVAGDLEGPMRSAPDPVVAAGVDLSLAARFAAGALRLFATAVTTYNTGVDVLNARWRNAPEDVPGPPGMQRVELHAELVREHAVLEDSLEDSAARTAGMLDRGPNETDVQFLTTWGLLPPADPFTDPHLLSALDKPGAGALSPDSGVSAEEAADWWASLGYGERLAVIAAYPQRVGNADGLPAGVRDEANRTVLAETISELTVREHSEGLTDEEQRTLANARHIDEQLADADQHVDPVTGDPTGAQLLIFSPEAFGGDGRAAIVIGDADTADNVALTVPGRGAHVDGGLGELLNDSGNLYDESRRADPIATTAVVAWVGYDAPAGGWSGEAGSRDQAEAGGELLASDVAGLQASRSDDPAHLTVIGHSYGSTTTAVAATDHGLQADDIILIGSPGAGDAGHAEDLGIGEEHVWVGSASRDPVTFLGGQGWANFSDVSLGNDPAEDDFGANRFQAESVDRNDVRGLAASMDDHSRYYDASSESLYNMGTIVTGRYEDVLNADARSDPLFGSKTEPEYDREPTTQSHD